jgi:hypothetical protein
VTDVTLSECRYCGNDLVSSVAIRGRVAIICDCCGARGPLKVGLAAAGKAWGGPDPRIAALEAQLAEARDCIDLFNRIIVRAECKWKEQHPDSEFYPDVPDLIVWLKEQVDKLGEAADA